MCQSLVDFSKPTVKQVSDFFYVFTYISGPKQASFIINGFKTALVETLGWVGHYITQSLELSRLLSCFHSDGPKNTRNVLELNLFLVSSELIKNPFEHKKEHMKEADIKHVTFKTAFLLPPQANVGAKSTLGLQKSVTLRSVGNCCLIFFI